MKAFTAVKYGTGYATLFIDSAGEDNIIKFWPTMEEAWEHADAEAQKSGAKRPFNRALAPYKIIHRKARTDEDRALWAKECRQQARKLALEQGDRAAPEPPSNLEPLVGDGWEAFREGWKDAVSPQPIVHKHSPIEHISETTGPSAAGTDRDELAGKLGVSTQEIDGEVVTISEKVRQIMYQAGVIIHLRISRWRATTQLKAEDLGLPSTGTEGEVIKSYVDLGRRGLLPKELRNKADALESKARSNLKYFGVETTWGFFVPAKAYPLWKERNEKIQKEYLELGDHIAKESPQIFKKVIEDYARLAPEIYKKQTGKDSPSEEWLKDYLQKISNKLPTPSAIRESFKYQAVFAKVPEKDAWKSSGSGLDEFSDAIKSDIENSTDPWQSPEGFYRLLNLQLIDDLLVTCSNSLVSIDEKNNPWGISPKTNKSLVQAVERYQTRRIPGDEGPLSLLDPSVDALGKAVGLPPKKRDKDEIRRLVVETIAQCKSIRTRFG